MLLDRLLNPDRSVAQGGEKPPPPDRPAAPGFDSFLEEVRAERLDELWKATLFVAFIAWWALVVLKGGRGLSLAALATPAAALGLGCAVTWRLLARGHFRPAAWAYAVGASAAVGFAVAFGGDFGRTYAAYLLPLLLFVVGLLLPARDTLGLLLISALGALALPGLAGRWEPSTHTLFALGLTALAAALAAQVSGELFAIADWALESYRKERRTTDALLESREALQRSFLRQQALTLELQHANRELEYARRAEEEAKNFRGQFLANMSHELRTPLNAIIGFSQTMLDFPAMYEGVALPGEYRQDMSQILGSGKHLLSIINDILDLSKVDAGKLDLEIQPFDLGPVIRSVLATAVGLVGDKGDRVRLLRTLPDPLPLALGDPLRVRQVLLNLYSNAAKFTEAGHINLIVRTEGRELVVAVEDTGVGIADADKVGLFDEFRQGAVGRRKGRQGSGLGLSISQKLLRLMRGRLWFESRVGKGSTFYFSLPLYTPPNPDQPDTEQADTKPLAPILPTAVR